MKIPNHLPENNPTGTPVDQDKLRSTLLAQMRIERAELALTLNLRDMVGVALDTNLITLEQAMRLAYAPLVGDTGDTP
jgi:hypothetical protein